MRLNVTLYRALAYVTGTVLIVLCVFTVAQAFANVGALVNTIGVLHGTLYIVYLIVAYSLTRRLGLRVPQTLSVLLAGTVPIMTFVVEHRVRHRYIIPALATDAAPGSRGAQAGHDTASAESASDSVS